MYLFHKHLLNASCKQGGVSEGPQIPEAHNRSHRKLVLTEKKRWYAQTCDAKSSETQEVFGSYWLEVLILSLWEKSEEPAASLECQAILRKLFVLALLEASKNNKQLAINQSSHMLTALKLESKCCDRVIQIQHSPYPWSPPVTG